MAQVDSSSRTNLTSKQRAEVFDRTAAKITKQYYDPKFKGTEWPRLAREAREQIVMLDDPEAFETAVHKLVSKLGTSHSGVFHQSVRRVPGRLAIGANFRRAETQAGPIWIVQDVHTGGPGSKAGLRRLDVLVAVNGKAVTPPETPAFPIGADVPLQLRRELQDLTLTISIPAPRSRKQPSAEIDLS